MADNTVASLQLAAGDCVPIHATCAIGRSGSNRIILPDEKVSRRHALVHSQGEDEFWLVDLGSSNGTYLNGRRVTHPIRLSHRDRIDIGPFQLVFSCRENSETSSVTTIETIHETRAFASWLIVTDIVGSTALGRKLGPEELPVLTGRWFDVCKLIIDRTGGTVDKYLGDGFFAYWPGECDRAQIASAVKEFKKLQAAETPAFRFVVHFGPVFSGGMATMGDARLFGPEVNFTFRMERLASKLGLTSLVSAPAREKIGPDLELTESGSHALPGFEGQFPFYKVQ